jgi:hypothetical protein
MGQPRAQRHQLVMVHPLGHHHHRRPGHPLGRGLVQGRRCLHLLQQLGVRHTTLRLDGLRTARLSGIQMDKPARLRTP